MAPYFIDFSGPVYIPGTRNIRDLSIVVIRRNCNDDYCITISQLGILMS